MNEIDKMRNSQLADMEKPEIQASFIHAKKLVAQLRMMSTYDDGFREVLEELVPGIPSTSVICPPFLLTSAVIINEKITWIALTGCFLILCGVYLAERKTNPTFEAKS